MNISSMTVSRFISNNPYRILGVYVGDSFAKETSNKSRISAYAKVEQFAAFPMKGDEILPPLQRTEEMAQNAAQILSLPSDRIKNALFWFADSDTPWASLLNNAVYALINDKPFEALSYYETLIQHDTIRTDFVDSVTHGLLHLNKEQLSNMLMDILADQITPTMYLSRGEEKHNAPYLLGLFFDKKIMPEINHLTKSFWRRGNDFYVLIDNLQETVAQILPFMRSTARILGTDDFRYKECAENVARAIYKQGKFIISTIGDWLWNTTISEGNKVQRATSRTYNSARICLWLMKNLAVSIEKDIKELQLDGDSYIIIGDTIVEFETEYRNQTNREENSLALVTGLHKIWSRTKTAIWLAFLIFIFIVA